VVSGLNGPAAVALDAAGDLFITNFYSSQVLEVPAGCTNASCQTTVGSGLNEPVDVAVDGAGNVFIADTFNNRVLEFARSQAPSLSFPATAVGATSSPQTVTVENIGSTPLFFFGFAASANFIVDAGTTTCSPWSPLAVGASCNVGVDCAPGTMGSLSGILTLWDDALDGWPARQTVSLSCTGTAAAIAGVNK